MVSPGSTRSRSPTLTASAGTAVSFPPVMTRAVCGVRWTSFSMPARARATVSSSRRPPSCMMNATSPAAKSSPMQTDAISASETSTSALMSNAVTRPMTASKMMGMPQRMIAAHEASNGRGTRSKMLTISAMPEIRSSVISFFVPPSSKKCSSFSIACFTETAPFCTVGGMGLLYIWGYRLSSAQKERSSTKLLLFFHVILLKTGA